MVRFAKSGLTPGFVRCRSHKPSARSPNEVLSERQRVRNRSELRLLAYPQPGCSQRLTTWKKNGRCVVPARVRGANRYSLRFLTRWRSLKPCARHGEQSILREAPQGRSDKMWSESTFGTNGTSELRPSPPAYTVGAATCYWEKNGVRRAIFFPSSQRLAARPSELSGGPGTREAHPSGHGSYGPTASVAGP